MNKLDRVMAMIENDRESKRRHYTEVAAAARTRMGDPTASARWRERARVELELAEAKLEELADMNPEHA